MLTALNTIKMKKKKKQKLSGQKVEQCLGKGHRASSLRDIDFQFCRIKVSMDGWY